MILAIPQVLNLSLMAALLLNNASDARLYGHFSLFFLFPIPLSLYLALFANKSAHSKINLLIYYERCGYSDHKKDFSHEFRQSKKTHRQAS